ncbi:hypothetical protein NM208_g8924 [Fusarium decemcellulare]|uniref:Uncharacterized protein n=1 Tax=Fusarium decemcellulare TaxID=57161 RepID=A0ACC1S3H2_9HYPO|nr:hypothetical protein NM208_g8924 [Fusarium decemcellulare]
MAPRYLHKLRGKSIVIVGGTSGVGFAVAEACLEFGAELVIVSRSQENVDKALHRLQASYPDAATSIQGYTCDLMSGQAEADIIQVFDLATQNGTNLVDHVISTAGSFPNPVTLADATSDDLVAASKYHFIGDLLLAKVAVRYLKPAYTSSITMTGGAGTFRPPPGWPLWAGVGGAKDALTRSLAVELKPIRVNLVSLGAIRTELFESSRRRLGIGDPQDVAETYLGLVKNHFATGTINVVDGGALLV